MVTTSIIIVVVVIITIFNRADDDLIVCCTLGREGSQAHSKGASAESGIRARGDPSDDCGQRDLGATHRIPACRSASPDADPFEKRIRRHRGTDSEAKRRERLRKISEARGRLGLTV